MRPRSVAKGDDTIKGAHAAMAMSSVSLNRGIHPSSALFPPLQFRIFPEMAHLVWLTTVTLLLLTSADAHRSGGRGGHGHGGHGGRGPHWNWDPMLANVTAEARLQYFQIVHNITLTKEERTAELDAWASEQSQDVQDEYSSRKSACQALKQNITNLYSTLSANMSTEARAIGDELMALADNLTLTLPQEWHQVQSIMASASMSVRSELRVLSKRIREQMPGYEYDFPVHSCCAVIGFCGLPGKGKGGRGPKGGRGGFPGDFVIPGGNVGGLPAAMGRFPGGLAGDKGNMRGYPARDVFYGYDRGYFGPKTMGRGYGY